MKLQPRWSIEDALAFGRLAMRVALEDARYWEAHKASDQFKYYEGVEASARETELALSRLLQKIGDDGLPTGIDLARTRVPRSLIKSGVVFVRLLPRGKLSGGSYTADQRRAQVASLVATRQLLGEITTNAGVLRKQTQHLSKINDRSADYGKQRLFSRWSRRGFG